jgi:hypothetical protein
MLRDIPNYEFKTSVPVVVNVEEAVHYYYYPAADIILRSMEDAFVPFYDLHEIVANYVLHIFQHRHPDANYYLPVWNACISKQFHTTVYC